MKRIKPSSLTSKKTRDDYHHCTVQRERILYINGQITISRAVYSSHNCVYDRVFKVPRKKYNSVGPANISLMNQSEDSESRSQIVITRKGYKEDRPSDLFLSSTAQPPHGHMKDNLQNVDSNKVILPSSTPYWKLSTRQTTSSISIPETPAERRMYKRLLDRAAVATPHRQQNKITDRCTIVIDDEDSTSNSEQALVLQRCKLSPIRRKKNNSIENPTETPVLSHVVAIPSSLDETDRKARSWLQACEQTPYLSDTWLNNLTSDYQYKAEQRERERQLAEVKLKHWENQRLSDHHRRMQNLEQRLSCLLLTPPVIHDPYLVPQPIPIELPYVPRKVASIPLALPVLTDSQVSQVDAALRGGPQDDILTENFRLSVSRRELLTLSGTNWLSDMVINFYMQLLSNRSKTPSESSPTLPRIAVLSTFFYAKLTSPTGTGYSGVRRWSRQLKLFDQDLILIPIHDRGMHWCLAAIDLKAKTISYYDSMGSPNQKCLDVLMSYMKEECQDKQGHPLPNPEVWKLISTEDSVPQQMNGSDCGVFMCTFGEFLSRNAKFTFSQDDMPGIRKRMAYEILTQQLLTTGFKASKE